MEPGRSVHQLGGMWRFRLDPEDLGERFADDLDEIWMHDARWCAPDYDDADWAEIEVPSCWQEHGYDYNGVAWYRRRFALEEPTRRDERQWLCFDGVDYYCDVWLNGYYLGSHEGYFDAFSFEITRVARVGTNVLAVRVDSPQDIRSKERQEWQLKSQLKGALQRWDVNNPLVNPGGIWNGVRMCATGPAALVSTRFRTVITESTERPLGEKANGRILVDVEVDHRGDDAVGAQVDVVAAAYAGEEPRAAATEQAQLCGGSGRTTATLVLNLEKARLWYPWDLGDQCLYRVRLSVSVDGRPSDATASTVGMRSITRGAGWETYVNGRRIFQRGANYLSDQFLSRMDRTRYERDVGLVRDANLNTLHPFCVVEKQELYDACDSYGLLVYQDVPMWLAMDDSGDLVRRAVPQMRRLIEQFGHHASIFAWNCGSQPSAANFVKLGHALVQEARIRDPRRIAHQANALLDYRDIQGQQRRSSRGDFHWAEETAETFAREYDWRIDTHQYFGWYYEKELPELARVPTRYLELVTEYGAQALPSVDMLSAMIPRDRLFPPRDADYGPRCFQSREQFRYIDSAADIYELVEKSQEYQARFLQFHTEYYRLNKYSPCNGAHMFCFCDCWPAITWSVLDYDRNKKAGYEALRRAMAPLQVLLGVPYRLKAGERREVSVNVVNDTHAEYSALTVDVRCHSAGSTVWEKRFVTAIGSDRLVAVGSVPLHDVGAARLDLECTIRSSPDAELVAVNRYGFDRIGPQGTDVGGLERRWRE